MVDSYSEVQALKDLREQVLKWSPEGWSQAREIVNQHFLKSNSSDWRKTQWDLLDELLYYGEKYPQEWPQQVEFFFNTLPYQEHHLWQLSRNGLEQKTYTEVLVGVGNFLILHTLQRHQLLPQPTTMVKERSRVLSKRRKLFHAAVQEGASGDYLKELLKFLECDLSTIVDDKIIQALNTPESLAREDLKDFTSHFSVRKRNPYLSTLWYIYLVSLTAGIMMDYPPMTLVSVMGLIAFY